LGSLSKNKFKKLCNEGQAFALQINKNDVYLMQPWFYSSFKGEKDELLKYKTHWNFIQSRYKDVNEKKIGMLKRMFRILLKRINIPLHHMMNLVTTCIYLCNMCVANSRKCGFKLHCG